MKSLLYKSQLQFILCTVIIFTLATPVFYFLTEHYYAEDLIEITNAIKQNKPLPTLDLEEDVLQGVMLQFLVISFILSISSIFVMFFISRKLWTPFDDTLKKIERFNLEGGVLPQFSESNIKEFKRLNNSLTHLIENNLKSYRLQKEFTENASHELQTPLAVIQSKLDMLLQLPELNEKQSEIVQSLYTVSKRMSHLNKNLLLLSKIDNNQYEEKESVNVTTTVDNVLQTLSAMTASLRMEKRYEEKELCVHANRFLLESLINNLIVNAIRHNIPDGEISVSVSPDRLIVSNSSNEKPMNENILYKRFQSKAGKQESNGLGLSIVKSICDYHHWRINYRHENNKHVFIVSFA